MASTRRSNFVRLAESRVNKALKSIRTIGNLSNKSNYEYSEDDIRKIMAALNKEIAEVRSRFKNQGISDSSEFKLKS
jgi:hypothetical protein